MPRSIVLTWALWSAMLLWPRLGRAADASWFIEAARARREGRLQDALQHLQIGPVGPQRDYLLARTHADLGEYEQAVAAAPGTLPADWPAGVATDFETRRRDWQARLGDCDALPEGKPMLRARCDLARKDPQRALEALKGRKDPAALALRVQALEASGKPEEAMEGYRRLLLELPADGRAGSWQAKLEQAPSWTVEERLDRAERWLAARRFEQAVEELEGVSNPRAKPLKHRLWHLRGTAMYRTRKRYDEAAQWLSRAARIGGKTAASDAFHAARATSRASKNRVAIRGYRKFIRDYPRNRRVPQARYLAAWLEQREGLGRARRSLVQVADAPLRLTGKAGRRSPQRKNLAQARKYAHRALWDLGWDAFGRRRYAQAARWLARYEHDARTDLGRARGAYWLARSLELAGQKKKAGEAYTRAMGAQPLAWYAQLAARRQGFPTYRTDAAAVDALQAPGLELPPEVEWYRRRGFTDDSFAAAKASLASAPKKGLEQVAAALAAGHAMRGHRLAVVHRESLLGAPVDTDTRWLWTALYPRPFPALVEAETARRGLPRDLLYAHMQVESRYDATAHSGADAWGLLQLLPQTARRVATANGIEYEGRESLVQPAVNVELAAAYLAGLLKRFRGQLPLAVAGYNAGGRRVEQWVEQHPGAALDEFVEHIPIDQTRNYVRRVLTHWARYRYEAAPEQPWAVARDLPEHVQALK